VKAKTAFESGNSPPKVSESGAVVETGRGLVEVERRIMEAFRLIHNDQPAPVKTEKQPQVYTETHAEKFHQRAKHLVRSATLLDALTSSAILKARTNANVWEIEAPQASYEDLIREALLGLGEDE
jgi:hypothetical protein